MSATMSATNVVYEISRVCALSLRLTHTQTITPAMVLYAVEVLFKTKMNEEIDEAYEKEYKKEINKTRREMSKHLDAMIEENIIEGKKYRIGGFRVATFIYKAKKTFGTEDPEPAVEVKNSKKTKKPKAEPPVSDEQKPTEPEPKKEIKKKTKKVVTVTEDPVELQVIMFEDGIQKAFDGFSGQELSSITDYLKNSLKVNDTNIKFNGEDDEELFITCVNNNVCFNEKIPANLKEYGVSKWGKVEFMFKKC